GGAEGGGRTRGYWDGPATRPAGVTMGPAWPAAALAAGSGQVLAGRQQVFARPDDPGGHARLARPAVGARVAGALVAHLPVDLEHAVVVREHVPRDRPGEGVLGVGVHVHLDHAVGDRLADFRQRRARAAVEDELERLVLAVLR